MYQPTRVMRKVKGLQKVRLPPKRGSQVIKESQEMKERSVNLHCQKSTGLFTLREVKKTF